MNLEKAGGKKSNINLLREQSHRKADGEPLRNTHSNPLTPPALPPKHCLCYVS